MSELKRRLAGLSPEKRRLLELRLEREKAAAKKARPQTPEPADALGPAADGPPRPMRFSLFFFSADGSREDEANKYHLLLESARFADRHGFDAVWTPERHFQDFGGLYPNPAVLGAALAVATERLEIRAGSVVLPLHHPVRVAEEWAVVDNLSGGRAAFACATGWHPTDFALRPENYEERREIMFRDLELIRRLWSGEAVEFPTGDGTVEAVRSLPRPVRKELPIWVTSSGKARTWEQAGEVGAHVLSSLGAQPADDLVGKIERFRTARARGGHNPGTVSLMLHTYLDAETAAARDAVRAPLSDYLRSHLAQRDSFLDLPAITEADKEALVPLAFEHYVRQASLIGAPEACSRVVNHLAALGVDEIACLVDFGLDTHKVLDALEPLRELVARHTPAGEESTP